ncbi:hypothetical protein GCM10029976_067570 [Kribbella albertanoniae]|uniref:Uncharacterized protein n=1 Tax=Kribbella albertanoniae TaxID=1266829 RepID=A0A4R4QJE1_9ACTN|nr:hypothetical protein [Kribbella albertanoniae]TDC35858.1 hypothetical protein E1261_00600 [Kribbella albertanoniae]
MGASMSTAYVAALPDAMLDWDAGSEALDEITDPSAFGWDSFELETQAEFLDDDGGIPEEPTFEMADLATLKKYGRRVLTELKDALDTPDVTLLTIGGYWIYLTGGLDVDAGVDDEYGAIYASLGLPDAVMKAVGFVSKPEDPPSRRSGAQGDATDTDVVDAIALGLGTKPLWSGADELMWIAKAISEVRTEPGAVDPVGYYEDFTGRTGFDPLDDGFLSRYVGDAADDHPDEQKAG